MRSSKGAVLAPLTGLLAVALFVAAIVIGGDTPDVDEGPQKILAFYMDNKSDQQASSFLLLYGTLFLAFFAAALRSGLRRGERDPEGPATLAFGGGLVMSVGLMLLAGLTIGLTDSVGDLDPISAQTIQALGNGLWVPFIAGQSMLMIGSGIAIIQGRALPVWLGWVAIVLGVVSATPVGWIGFMVVLLWIVIVSILLARRAGAHQEATAVPASD